MSIRLLADADLNFAIVKGCRLHGPGIDFLSAVEAGLEGIGDREVLNFAASQGRILVSHDVSTIPVHFARTISEGRKSPGVFLVSQDAVVSDVIAVVVLIWSASMRLSGRTRLRTFPHSPATYFRDEHVLDRGAVIRPIC